MTARSRSTSAFTLPEVLAALVLVGLVLPGVMKGVSLSMSAADDARKRVEAVGLAESKLEELVANASTSGGGGSSSGDFGEAWPAYRWESSSNSIDSGLTEVSVRVVWMARGSERSVGLATFAYAGAAMTTTTAPPAANPSGGGTP